MKDKPAVMMRVLVIQFFLGMLLNLIGEPQADWSAPHKIIAYFFFVWHVLNAIGLVAIGWQLWRDVKLSAAEKVLATRGFGSLALAFVGGLALILMHPIAEVASFVMATGFILAFIFYGQLYMRRRGAAPA